jgi:hypothetical protein
MNIFGLIFSFLASDAGQSMVRSTLKVGGGLLLSHGVSTGVVDAGALDTILGGLMAGLGVVSSFAAHSASKSAPAL